jgi:hypothetical protein
MRAERTWVWIIGWHLWQAPFKVIAHAQAEGPPWQRTACGISLDHDRRGGRLVGVSNLIAALFAVPCRRCWPAERPWPVPAS